MDDDARWRTARSWGIDTGYHDWRGRWREASPEVLDAVRAAMGAEPGSSPPPSPVRVVRAGRTHHLPGRGEVLTEDGRVVPVDGQLPVDLPCGYHELHLDGDAQRLIVTPGRCPTPREPGFGFAVQLYAARSSASWGMGDLADLRRLGRWAASLGARLLLVNPLDAALPLADQEPSPYYPSSRRFHNPLYLRVEEVPGAQLAGGEALAAAATAGRALNGERRIDRRQVFRLKTAALEAIYAASGPAGAGAGGPAGTGAAPGSEAGFEAYRAARGPALRTYATFCALAESHGSGWPGWPRPHHRPSDPTVAEFAARHHDRIRFHEWLQWLLDLQLARAGAEIPLASDLPIGFDPGGADAWTWQDRLALDVRVGLPPDEYNTKGQDWGFPPFDPWKLRADAYQPFVETVRAAMAHASGLRVDHVAGLFRLYWALPGGEGQGTFVRYPHQDLLGILALESQRAGAFVVGEDLGQVEDVVRAEMAAHGMLSYRLLWFEEAEPPDYPEQALAAITTHDLFTVAGLWEGSDLETQRRLGLEPNEEATLGIRRRLAGRIGLSDGAPAAEAVARAHALLARSPSVLVTATLEDALCVEERPNHPGTVAEWPNWSLALPLPLEELERDPRAQRLARCLGEGRGATGPDPQSPDVQSPDVQSPDVQSPDVQSPEPRSADPPSGGTPDPPA